MAGEINKHVYPLHIKWGNNDISVNKQLLIHIAILVNYVSGPNGALYFSVY